MKKKWFCIVMVLALLLAGCGGGTSETETAGQSGGAVDAEGHITLQFWYALGGDSGEAVESLVKSFNESQSEITVVPTYQGGYASTMAKIWSALAANNLPAVAQVGGAPLLGETGAIVPIEDYFNTEDGIDPSLILDSFWDYNTAEGKIWSMPFNHSVPVLYYNRDLFTAAGLDPDAPPQTWDEVIEYGKKLTLDTDGNGEIDQWGFNTKEDTHWYLSTMFMSNGVQIVNAEETEMLYNSPEAVEMLTLWSDMVNTYKIMPPNQHSESKGDFLAGKLGMLLMSSSSIPGMEEEAPFALGVGMVPAVSGKELVVPIGGASLVITQSDNETVTQAALKFVKYMTSRESAVALSTDTGYVPIYKDALDWPELADYFTQYPNRRVPVAQLEYAQSIPEFSALGTSDLELRKAVESVELGEATPQEALDRAKKVVDENMNEQQSQ